MKNESRLIPTEAIDNLIHVVRGQRVMLDSDLAELFGVETKALNRAVKRNRERFPLDFMFLLTVAEAQGLRCQLGTLETVSATQHSQTATTKRGRGQHRKYLPYAFTEHGAIMAANVLNSPRAVQASVFVVRAFVRMRQTLTAQKGFAEKLAELEHKLAKHDIAIREVVEAIKQLAALPEPQDEAPPKERIGFLPK